MKQIFSTLLAAMLFLALLCGCSTEPTAVTPAPQASVGAGVLTSDLPAVPSFPATAPVPVHVIPESQTSEPVFWSIPTPETLFAPTDTFPAAPEAPDTFPPAQTAEPVITHPFRNHEFGDWELVEAPSCLAEGKQVRRCVCGAEEEESVPGLPHTYGEQGFCTVCGERAASVGLEMWEAPDGSYAVSGPGECTDTDLIIPDTYLAKPVTLIGWHAFLNRAELTSVTLNNNLKEIGIACFSGCTGLKEINIPASVERIDRGAFSGCVSLASVTFHEGLQVVDSDAFAQCVSLTELVFPDTLEGMTACVNGCVNLRKLDLGSGAAFIDNRALENLTMLEELRFGAGMKTISSSNFFNTVNLKTIDFDGTIGDWVTIEITSDSSAPFLNGIQVTFRGEPIPSHVVIPEGVETIQSYVLANAAGIEEVTLPSSLKEIKQNAFSGMEDLIAVNGLEHTAVTVIGAYAFTGCKKLKQIDFPNTLIKLSDEVFCGCESLETVSLKTALQEIGSFAFRGCSSLQRVHLGLALRTVGFGVFQDCTALTEIEYEGSEAVWNTVNIDWNWNEGTQVEKITFLGK